VLPNGLEVRVGQLPHSRTAVVYLAAKVGSRDDPDHRLGLAHFVEHLIFRGCERFPSESEIQRQFARLGAYFNATTGLDYTVYNVTVRAQYLREGLWSLAEVLRAPLLHGFEAERRIILDEFERKEAEDWEYLDSFEAMLQQVWGGNAVCRGPTLGVPRTIAAITPDDVRAHLRRYYGAANLKLAIVGPAPPDELLELARPFEALPVGLAYERPPPPQPRRGTAAFVTNARRSTLRLAFPQIVEERQVGETYAVLNELLSGSSMGLLHNALRTRRALAYSAGSSLDTQANFLVQQVYSSSNHDHAEACLSEVLSLLDTLRRLGPGEVELRAARESLLRVYEDAAISPASQAWNQLCQALIGGSADLEESLRSVELVTAAQVRELAQALFASGRGHLLISGSPRLERPLAKLWERF
jgi:predicted Zn-dependent peptidase